MASKSLQAIIFGVDKASPVFQQVGKSSETMGEKIKAVSRKAVGSIAAIAGAGAILKSGWDRLTSIENAQAKLEGLGHSAGEVKAIMTNALAAVKGTAFGLDEAANVAATAVAAGIKPGAELQRVLGLVADAATIAGTDMQSMGSIFNKVAAQGHLTGEVVQQLSDQGIPILSMLGKTLGKTTGEIQKMVTQGKISFDDFAKAMEQGLGGAALKSGNTTTGALKNMMASFARFGATLLQDVQPVAKQVFGAVTGAMDGLGKAAGGLIRTINGIPGPVKLALAAMAGWKLLQQTGLFAKLAGAAKGFREEMALQQGLAKMAGQELSSFGAAAATTRVRVGALAKSLAPGAGVMLGLTILSGAISEVQKEMHLTDQVIEDHKAAVKSLASAYKETGGAITDMVRAQAWADIATNSKEVVAWAKANNIAMDQLVDAYLNLPSGQSVRDKLQAWGEAKHVNETSRSVAGVAKWGSAVGALAGKIQDAADASELQSAQALAFLGVQADATQAVKDEEEAVKGNAVAKAAAAQQTAYVDQLLRQHDAATGATQSGADLNKSMQENEAAAKGAKAQADRYVASLLAQHSAALKVSGADGEVSRQAAITAAKVRNTAAAMKDANTKAHDLTGSTNELEAAMARLSGREPTVEEATRRFNGALTDAIEKAKGAKGAVTQLGSGVVGASGQIRTGTKAGQDLYDTMTSMGKAAQEAAFAQASLAGKTGGTTAAANAASRSLANSRAEFLRNAHAMGLTAAQAKALADRYFGIPKNIRTVVTGVANFRDVDNKIQRLADGFTIPVRGQYTGTNGMPAWSSGLIAHADGGAVEGPGVRGRDSLLRVLAPGEHVLTDRDVTAMGGQQGVYAFRRALHRGSAGMASGGAVGGDGARLPVQFGAPVVNVQVNVPGGFVGSARQLADALVGPLTDAVAAGRRRGTVRAGVFGG